MSKEEEPRAGDVPADLDQQLRALRDGLDEAQKQLKHAEVDIALHESQIEVLSKLIDQFEKIISDYEAEQPKLAASQKTYADYARDETKCLNEILGPVAAQVPVVVANCRAAVTSLSNQIKAEERTLADRKVERDAAEKERDTRKAAFEAWKSPAASINDRLKALEALRGEIKKAHDAGQYALAYWLLTDKEKFDGKLSAPPQPITAEEVRDKLKDAWDAYRTAAEDFQALDGEVKGREKALETRKTQFTNMQKQLEATIRLKLAELLPVHSRAA